MRRAIPAAAITVVGLAALASFRSTAPVVTNSAAAHTPTSTPTPTTTTPAAGAAPPPSGTRTTAPSTASSTRTVTGDVFDNRFGPVQVRVTLSGHQILAVDAVQLPSDHPRSAYISQQAGPLLQQETLQAQSAQIDVVSGATYTSQSYAQSLQSALDRA